MEARHWSCPSDVSKEPDVQRAVATAVDAWNGLDVCVALAGIEPADRGDASVDRLDLAQMVEADRAICRANPRNRPRNGPGAGGAGALLLYDEAHLLADDRPRERYPLSGLLSALGQVQRAEPRVRVVLSGLPTLSLNLKRARTYAERIFRHVVVGNLDRDDAWDALGIPLAGSGRRQPALARRRPRFIPLERRAEGDGCSGASG
jgi:hypothetical protein